MALITGGDSNHDPGNFLDILLSSDTIESSGVKLPGSLGGLDALR